MYCKAEREVASSEVVDVILSLNLPAIVVRVDGTQIPTVDEVAVTDASV